MLVLSRKIGESITLPACQTVIHFLRHQNSLLRIGVQAPANIKILRSELLPLSAELSNPAPPESIAHRLSNRLSRISLALHLCQRQAQTGRHADAKQTLQKALQTLEEMDRDWLERELNGDFITTSPPPAPQASAGEVLLVEDDPNERELLAGLLGMNGCQCNTCPDGEAALAYLNESAPPKVVLLDMRMPRCDGPNTLRRLRENPRFDAVKVFSISNTPPQSLGLQVGPGGLDGWFPKPLNPRTLWDALRQNLQGADAKD